MSDWADEMNHEMNRPLTDAEKRRNYARLLVMRMRDGGLLRDRPDVPLTIANDERVVDMVVAHYEEK